MMRKKINLWKYAIILLFFLGQNLRAQDKPNILWLCIEDLSTFHLPAYGNTIIETPNVDRLVQNGIVFNNAYSNGSACSPARATLITGVYSSVLAAEQHRRDVNYPHDLYWTKQHLEENGYWTSNIAKTDYNIKNEGSIITSKIWTNIGDGMNAAPADQPFFCFENNFDTHMSKITNTNEPGERNGRTVFPNEVNNVPSYVPDGSWMKDDMAWIYHKMKEMDDWVGERLDYLENSGKADNTIIFFMADNGGSVPGAKGFLRQDGMKIPFIAVFPEKWSHYAPSSTNGISNEIVEFVDFPATVLDMAGVEVPDYMQGRIFAGPNKQPEQKYAYGIRANQGYTFIPSRALTDGDFKFIWNYNSFFTNGFRKSFQFQMPSFREWEEAYRAGGLPESQASFWESMSPFELYDLSSDPGEINNLADNPAFATRLTEMKAAMSAKIRKVKDIGLNPFTLRDTTATSSLYSEVRNKGIDLEPMFAAAELASEAEASDVEALLAYVKHPNITARYWGVTGFARLAYHNLITELPQELYQLANNQLTNQDIRLMGAYAMSSIGDHCSAIKIYEDFTNFEAIPYITVLKDPKPYAQYAYDMHLTKKGNFRGISCLINMEILNYDQLFASSSELVYDLSILDASAILDDCSNDEDEDDCDESLIDDFSGTSLPTGWEIIKGNLGTEVSLANGKLNVVLDGANTGGIVERTYTSVNTDKASLSLDFNASRNFLKTNILFKNQVGDTIGAIVIGNNSVKRVITVSNKEELVNNDVVTYTDILGEELSKQTDYTLSVEFDFDTNTYSASLDGYDANVVEGIPLWEQNADFSKLGIDLAYVFSNEGVLLIDNVVYNNKPTSGTLDSFNLKYAELENLIYNSSVGHQVGSYPFSAYEILYIFYTDMDKPNCEASQTLIDELIQNIDDQITSYKSQIIVAATQIDLSGNTALDLDEVTQLNVLYSPSNADKQLLDWSSSDDNIAEVDEFGQITARSEGVAIITATTKDGLQSDSIEISVSGTSLSVNEVTNSNDFKIWPNPNTTGILNVSNAMGANYKLYNLIGSLIKSGKIVNNQLNVKANRGLYLLEITLSDKNIINTPVIIR